MKQLDATNKALVNVKEVLKDNSKQTIEYIAAINQGVQDEKALDDLPKPQLKDLQNCLHELTQTVRTYNRI